MSKNNTFLDMFLKTYLESCLSNFGEEKVNLAFGKEFPELKFTKKDYGVLDLTDMEKIKLMNLLFDLDVATVGQKTASEGFEKHAYLIKQRLGSNGEFAELLKDFPVGVFENEKLKDLQRDELEDKIILYRNELDKVKKDLDRQVSLRTLELLTEKDMLESILYNTSDGVFALDRQSRVMTFNKAMERLTGFAFSEVEKRSVDEVVRLFEDSVLLDSSRYNPGYDFSEDKNVYLNDNVTLVSRNGTKKYVGMISSVISGGRQANLGCIVTLKDNTKEKELELMKLDFVSIAAHELRTPLTSIRGYLSLIKDETKGKLAKDISDYLERVVISADQLHILVENLLNISRIERGTIVLERNPEDFVSIVKSAIDRFSESAQSLGISLLYIEDKEQMPKVLVDKTMIMEVLSNLIDNAIKYTHKGGRVSVFLESSPGFVITHIKDTGPGIPPESMPHIFKKFYRVSGVLKQGVKGTGLGLFISKEIVRLHGGNIWLESEPEKGSTFSFSVPVQGV